MLRRLKSTAAVLIGLAIGLVAALPLVWVGVRKGGEGLMRTIGKSVHAVEVRQQALADQALELEPLLRAHGYRLNADVFTRVQDRRSRLAGSDRALDKLEAVQRLEEALLRAERVWGQAGAARPTLRASFDWQEHGRVWEKQKRLLVVEQKQLADSVQELNLLLARWPASVILGHKSFGALLNDFFNDVAGNIAFLTRLSLDWAGYGMRKAAALVGQQAPPEPPKWEKPKARVAAAFISPVARPVFYADAPLPEEDVRELQYTRENDAVDYSEVEIGEDKPVLENRDAPEEFKAVVPKPQATVDYRSPR